MSHMTELSIENTCRGCLNSEHIFLLPLIICKAGKSQVSVKCQEHSVETGAFCCKFAFPPTFQCPSNKKSGAFQKIAELFLFFEMSRPHQCIGETWIGGVVVHLVGLHSHQKSFTQMESLYNQIYGQQSHPSQSPRFQIVHLFSFTSLSNFPISLSSIYKSFPSKLSSLFSSRRSLVIWFNYNCSTRQIFGKHTQINQANTDTLQLDQQKRQKLEQK